MTDASRNQSESQTSAGKNTHKDLHEQLKLKELLEENEAKYKYLFEHSNIGIGISTLDGKLLEANAYLLNLFDIPASELPNIDLNNYYKFKQDRQAFIKEISTKGSIENFKFEFLKKTGESLWLSVSSTKILHKGKERFINTIANIDQQERNEQRLIESEERFKQLSKLTTEGILIHHDGIVLDANDSMLKMIGYTILEIRHKPFNTYCCSKSSSEEEINRAINSPYRVHELILKHKNGKLIPVELSGRPATFNGEKVKVTSFRDISDRIATENTISLLNTAVEQSAHAILITNEKGVIEYVNPMFTVLTKYTSEEVIDQNISILESGHHSQAFFAQLWETISKGEVWKGEFFNKDKNGNNYWVSSTITPIKNNHGKIINFLSVMEDITIRKQEKEELEKLHTQLKLALEAAKFGFWEFNITNKKAFLDENMRFLLKLDDKNSVSSFEQFKSLLGEERWVEFRKKILFGLQQKNVVEVDTPLTLGKVNRFFKSYILENPVAHNNESSILGITYDITEQKNFQEELIKERKRAEESDQLKSAFLANMSHEIRTPLNGIIGFTYLLENELDEFTPDEITRYLNIISTSGKHLLTLVNDIIDLSKIESNQLIIANQKFKLGDVLEKLKDIFKNSCPENVEMIFDQDFANLEMRTDSTRLTQILTNLIGNAIKYTKSGYIKIGHKADKNILSMYVKDSGAGIEKNTQSIIFNRFAQSQPKKDQLLGGTGLGLSITKGLVKLLGGHIWFDSIPGKGSTFYFTVLIKNPD